MEKGLAERSEICIMDLDVKKKVEKAKLNHKTCLVHLMSEEHKSGMDCGSDVVERRTAY